MIEKRRTLCNRDCPDTCSIIATVDDGRVTQLQGDPEHPITKGFLCYRTSHFLHQQYSPDRIKTPLIREGETFRAASWDEALSLIAEKLRSIIQESGPAAIFHYRSGGSLGLLKMLSDYFFEQLGPVTIKTGDICSGAGDVAQMTDFGEEESSDIFQLLHAKNIILWGKNVYTSSPHLLPILKQAKANGAILTLIDPVHHRTAKLCDHFYQVAPGADFALAMAVARVLLEKNLLSDDAHQICENLPAFVALAQQKTTSDWCQEANLPTETAEAIALTLSQSKPTTILIGWGMARRSNGGAIVRAIDALAAISGNLGIKGGGASYYFKRRGAFDCTWIKGEAVAPRLIKEPLFGEEILSAKAPEIRAVWITAGNPVAMLPDSYKVIDALKSRELVVVVDSWMSDTAKLAHVILPTTTLLEDDDLLGSYGHHWIGASTPVIPAPDQVKSDLEIIQLLAEKMGLSEVMRGDAARWKERFISKPLRDAGVTLQQLTQRAQKNPLVSPVLFEDKKFSTKSKRAQLIDYIPTQIEPTNKEFPMYLVAVSTERSQSSQWPILPDGPAEVVVHPDAASGIEDGGLGRLVSALGALQVKVKHDPKQRRDIALMAKGGHVSAGRCANAITRARLTDLGDGGALYEERVRLESVGVARLTNKSLDPL
jgi:anaerobic selenocysteine-containing dehydrogenase